MRKYFSHAKAIKTKKLDEKAKEKIKQYYLKMRQTSGNQETKSISITTRQLEGLFRLSESSAKLRLSETIEEEDADRAIIITDYMLREIAFDPETGTISVDIIRTGQTPTELKIAEEITRVVPSKERISFEDLKEQLKKNIKIPDEQKLDRIISKMKQKADIFEPSPGYYSKL